MSVDVIPHSNAIVPHRIIASDTATGVSLVNFSDRPDMGTLAGELWYTVIDRNGVRADMELIMPGPDGWTPSAAFLRELRGDFRSIVQKERRRLNPEPEDDDGLEECYDCGRIISRGAACSCGGPTL